MKIYDLASKDLITANDYVLLLKAERARAKDQGLLDRASRFECMIFDAEELKEELFG